MANRTDAGHGVGEASSIRIGCAHLGAVRHICAFFHDDQEAWRVLMPFIADGFAAGDRALHILRPDRELTHLRRLSETGIDVPAAQAGGQLELRSNVDTYLADGRFDGERMFAAFEAVAKDKHGYKLSRIVCEMDWATERPSLFEDVIRFEARVNDVWSRHEDVVICIYDIAKVSGDMVIDLMRTHPVVLIGDVLHENPFYVPPDEFLRERAERRSLGSATP
jgi:hypothetical protein